MKSINPFNFAVVAVSLLLSINHYRKTTEAGAVTGERQSTSSPRYDCTGACG